MKSTNLFTLFSLILIIASSTLVLSCQKENISTENDVDASEINVISNSDIVISKRKKKKKDDPEPPINNDPFVTTYQLYEAIDGDPLYRFSISQSGELMLLESDPTVAGWGNDFWGTWSDPFPYLNSEVNYIKGLTNTTYQFQQISPETIDVTKILIVQPYPNGEPITTESHPGIYTLVE